MSSLTFSGQTDEVLQVKLPSQIISASWKSSSASSSGTVLLEVQTIWVADRSELEIIIYNGDGKKLETLKGKIFANLYRKKLEPPRDASGELYFEAKLKAHSLEMTSDTLAVLPPVDISDLKILDAKEKVLTEISKETELSFNATFDGPPDETEVLFSLYCQIEPNKELLQLSKSLFIKDSMISLDHSWSFPIKEEDKVTEKEIRKDGEDYFTPVLSFQVECLGKKMQSDPIPYVSWVEFNFGEQRGKAKFELPDGSIIQETIPSTGIVSLKQSMVGTIYFIEIEEAT